MSIVVANRTLPYDERTWMGVPTYGDNATTMLMHMYGRSFSVSALHSDWSFCFEDNDVVVEDITRDISATISTTATVGLDGSMYLADSIDNVTLTYQCRAFKDTYDEFNRLMEVMYKFLNPPAGKPLVLASRYKPECYCLARIQSIDVGDFVVGTGIGSFTVTFLMNDPTWYSRELNTIQFDTELKSFGDVTCKGTYPSPFILELTLPRDWRSGLYGGRRASSMTYDGKPGFPITVTNRGLATSTKDTTMSYVIQSFSNSNDGDFSANSLTKTVGFCGYGGHPVPRYSTWPSIVPGANTFSFTLLDTIRSGSLKFHERYL